VKDRPIAKPVQYRKTETYNHASSWIRTHDPSARAIRYHELLRPHGHWDRHLKKIVNMTRRNSISTQYEEHLILSFCSNWIKWYSIRERGIHKTEFKGTKICLLCAAKFFNHSSPAPDSYLQKLHLRTSSI